MALLHFDRSKEFKNMQNNLVRSLVTLTSGERQVQTFSCHATYHPISWTMPVSIILNLLLFSVRLNVRGTDVFEKRNLWCLLVVLYLALSNIGW